MAFEIVTAQPEHIDQLTQLFAQAHNDYYVTFLPHFFRPVSSEFWRERLLKALNAPNYYIFVVLDTDHHSCAGFSEIFIRNTTAPYIIPEQRLVINNIYIAPHYRRRGLASLLLEHIQHFARQHRIATLELEVASTNTAAQRLYTRFGFTPRTITMEQRLSDR